MTRSECIFDHNFVSIPRSSSAAFPSSKGDTFSHRLRREVFPGVPSNVTEFFIWPGPLNLHNRCSKESFLQRNLQGLRGDRCLGVAEVSQSGIKQILFTQILLRHPTNDAWLGILKS